MAVFDLGRRRLAVRVVYDGPAGAGKTTNVLTLSELLPLSRKLRDDGHRDGLGRTLTFDWEEIDSGVAAELPLACEILSVPGQAALAPRRRALLATADVVVFVCDASAERLELTRACLEGLRASLSPDVPIVLQANKQDGPSALPAEELARLLGLDGARAHGAIARDQDGVVHTFVTAVRAFVAKLTQANATEIIRLPVRHREDRAALARRLATIAVDDDAASELLLEELLADREDAEEGRPP